MKVPSSKHGNSKSGGSPFNKAGALKIVIVLLMILGFYVFIIRKINTGQNQGIPPTYGYSKLKEQLRNGNIEKIRTSGDQIDVWLKEPLEERITASVPTAGAWNPTGSSPDMKIDTVYAPTPGVWYPTGSLITGKSNTTSPPTSGNWDPLSDASEIKVDPVSQIREVTQFKTYLPSIEDPSLMPLLEEQEVLIESSPGSNSSSESSLLSLMLMLAFIPLGFLLLQRMSITNKSESMGGMTQSPGREYSSELGRITFQDVAGSSYVKQELQEVIEFLKDPERFNRLGAKIPKGVLLVGPPGTGKTLLARAVAGEAEVPFLAMSGSDFMELFVGVGAARVRKLFEQAKKSAPTIIFIDELDSIGRRRSSGSMPGNEERDQTLNQLLSEMDGFQPSDNVIVMAATNRPEILDPAIQRPGRFDRQVVVDNPTLQDRIDILRVHSRNKTLDADIDLEAIARGTPGLSGADLANLLNEAALLAARKSRETIGPDDVNEARDKVLIGLERNINLTEEDVRLIAYHEAGHALVAAVLPHADPVHKVTIIPRGMSMGATQQLPERDRFLYSSDYLLDLITVMMGGRAAEELALSVMTSGASNDLKQATNLARKMVLEWGMSPRFGAIFMGGENGSFLEESLGYTRGYSETTAREVDEEIRTILKDAYARAKAKLVEHRQALERLVQALLEKEEIQGEEVYALLQSDDRQIISELLQ